MLHKEVVRPIRINTEWCSKHNATKRPGFSNWCWEQSVWVQEDDCEFSDAILVTFSPVTA